MSFRNSILAGEDLVRTAIRSPNYVAGVSGWRIARNGDAEFNNVTVRGQLITAPPPGERIEIGTAGASIIEFFTGDAAESLRGTVFSDVLGAGGLRHGALDAQAPQLQAVATGEHAILRLRGESVDGTQAAQAFLNADASTFLGLTGDAAGAPTARITVNGLDTLRVADDGAVEILGGSLRGLRAGQADTINYPAVNFFVIAVTYDGAGVATVANLPFGAGSVMMAMGSHFTGFGSWQSNAGSVNVNTFGTLATANGGAAGASGIIFFVYSR